jgi:ABC-type branched-subunit amino acid transport system permease subunit
MKIIKGILKAIGWFCLIILAVGLACSLPQITASMPLLKSSGTNLGSIVLGFILFLCILFFYFLPTYTANKRNHPQKQPISIINLFLGWTLIGWVIALAWAYSAPPLVQSQPQPHQSK